MFQTSLRSALVSLDAKKPCASKRWCARYCGFALSPYRPHHVAKNRYVGIALHGYSLMRFVSRPLRLSGLQHVNKTDSAVRATHRRADSVKVRRSAVNMLNKLPGLAADCPRLNSNAAK
ncbi:hypothetical protein KCP76_15265 [Salmonella enterica subsp. enterica serovar Weltevreden]|nr:hypothetical protein KCP76_15265 [Salmonella enterica subsp. enterica serovar Weltevreden]